MLPVQVAIQLPPTLLFVPQSLERRKTKSQKLGFVVTSLTLYLVCFSLPTHSAPHEPSVFSRGKKMGLFNEL